MSDLPAVIFVDPPPVIKDGGWTEIALRSELSEGAHARLLHALDLCSRGLDDSGAPMHEQCQARAYIGAILALAAAPEPPLDLIWGLLAKLSTIESLFDLFYSIWNRWP